MGTGSQADPARGRRIKTAEVPDHGIVEAGADGGDEAVGPGGEMAGLEDDVRVGVGGGEFLEEVDARVVRHGGVGAQDLVPVFGGAEGGVGVVVGVVVFGGEGAGPEGLVGWAGDEFLVVVAGGEAEPVEGCLGGWVKGVSLRRVSWTRPECLKERQGGKEGLTRCPCAGLAKAEDLHWHFAGRPILFRLCHSRGWSNGLEKIVVWNIRRKALFRSLQNRLILYICGRDMVQDPLEYL